MHDATIMDRTKVTERLRRFSGLGGFYTNISTFETAFDQPRMSIAAAKMSNLGEIRPELKLTGSSATTVLGAGAGLDQDEALCPALAEALERYSTCIFRQEQFIRATANELGGEALDLDTVPCCSPTELAHPKCPLVRPDKTKPIRWVRGISLFDGRICYIPAIMAYSHAGIATPAERFWLPTSTGCAAHVSYERALLSGLYEVVERDAISSVWLQRIALPRIEIDFWPADAAAYGERYKSASSDLEYCFFDATTDLGVPTVYGLQIAAHDKAATTLVSCATGTSGAQALAKVMRDMAAYRLAFRVPRSIPESWDDFSDLLDGATYMARREQASAFDFLKNSKTRIPLSEMRAYKDEGAAFQRLMARMIQKQLDAYVVDISTDEAIRAEMRVVRVIVNGLQPLSFRYRARFLGHERLYKAPGLFGHPAFSEAEVNAWPQPFA